VSVETELRALVREIVREELALAQTDNGSPWMTTEQVAELLGTSVAAIHTRLTQGWMKHARVRDGKRVLFERKALLKDLQERRRR
jgi:excisionase family DNA binding protein